MSVLSGGLRGVVRGGVVVLETPMSLAEGTEVEIMPARLEFTAEEKAEFAGWEQLGDEAWAMIEDLEKQDRDARG